MSTGVAEKAAGPDFIRKEFEANQFNGRCGCLQAVARRALSLFRFQGSDPLRDP